MSLDQITIHWGPSPLERSGLDEFVAVVEGDEESFRDGMISGHTVSTSMSPEAPIVTALEILSLSVDPGIRAQLRNPVFIAGVLHSVESRRNEQLRGTA